MRVVAHGNQLRRVYFLVEGAVGVDVDGDSRRKVELRVESASAVAGLDRRRSAELPDIGGAGSRAVKALLDAVAFVLDEREGEVDFGDNARHIESLDIWRLLVNSCTLQGIIRPTADAPLVSNMEIWADALLSIVIIALRDGTGEDGGGEEKGRNGGSEMHFDLY